MPLPIPQYPLVLITRKEYKVTQHHVVSLCVVENRYRGRQIRLYRWRRNREHEPWSVALTNCPIHDINLEQMARDAIQFSTQYQVAIDWPTDLGAPEPTNNEAAEIEPEIIEEVGSEPEKKPRPPCPKCGSSEEVVPIVYGFFDPSPKQSYREDFVAGGWTFSAESPLWHCTLCGAQWGKVAWTEDLSEVPGASPEISEEDIPF
jgi:hypothetical protein